MTTIGVFAGIFDEAGRILCVRHAYGAHDWGLPGGQMETHEDPVSALRREAFEEAAVIVEVETLVGLYSATYRDDLVILFRAGLRESRPWAPTDEIAEIGFFAPDALPEPMPPNVRLRIADLAAGAGGLVRALSAPGETIEAQSLSGMRPR